MSFQGFLLIRLRHEEMKESAMAIKIPQKKNTISSTFRRDSNRTCKTAQEQIDIKQKEYRCPQCKRLLLKGEIIKIEIKCAKCKKVCTIIDS